MATSLISVNDLFLQLVNDYRLNLQYEASIDNFNVMLEGWLLYAIVDFQDICGQDLIYDVSTKKFSVDLTLENKIILAKLMRRYWFEKEVNDMQQIRNLVVDHDFKRPSAAQNLKEKKQRLSEIKEENELLLNRYEYKNNDWDNWINQIFDE